MADDIAQHRVSDFTSNPMTADASEIKAVVTGAAGFIGFSICSRLLSEGATVVGMDNLNAYYNPRLKAARVRKLRPFRRFTFNGGDIRDIGGLGGIFAHEQPNLVIHLAARPGVRSSLSDPISHVEHNVIGMANVLEACRHESVSHLIYASSSSVYGMNEPMPFSPEDPADYPTSVYAATKRSNELMAHAYSHLYGLVTTGLRLFTVYGPWGRPDMAYYSFATALVEGRPVTLYGDGSQTRDFTYVDDAVECMMRLAVQLPGGQTDRISVTPDGSSSSCYKILNVGSGRPVSVMRLLELLEDALGAKGSLRFEPPVATDVSSTEADVTALRNAIGFVPETPVEEGIPAFADWFLSYHGCKA